MEGNLQEGYRPGYHRVTTLGYQQSITADQHESGSMGIGKYCDHRRIDLVRCSINNARYLESFALIEILIF